MTLGTWTDGASIDDPGTWSPVGTERTIDTGNMYAGKDFEDTANNRRIFFGWATVATNPQTLARVVTYHPQLQQLIFSPAPEYEHLHEQQIGHLGELWQIELVSFHYFVVCYLGIWHSHAIIICFSNL
jgi:hypothetical protein